MKFRIPVGSRVTCQYRGQHQGTVIPMDDPRAWAGSIAFPSPNPSAAEVKSHVACCQASGNLRGDYQPVLWDFGKVYWDSKLEQLGVKAVITDEEHYAHA